MVASITSLPRYTPWGGEITQLHQHEDHEPSPSRSEHQEHRGEKDQVVTPQHRSQDERSDDSSTKADTLVVSATKVTWAAANRASAAATAVASAAPDRDGRS